MSTDTRQIEFGRHKIHKLKPLLPSVASCLIPHWVDTGRVSPILTYKTRKILGVSRLSGRPVQPPLKKFGSALRTDLAKG